MIRNVNDFDIQLFAEEGDTVGEPNPPTKIKVGENEYTPDEILSAMTTSKQDADWKKANTVAAQKNAEERRALESERQVIEGWRPVIDKYSTEEDFKQALDDILEGKQPTGLGDEFSELAIYKKELQTTKQEIAEEKRLRLLREQGESNRIIETDKQQIAAKIKTSGDMFSYDDVTAFADENQIPMLSVAYDILRGSDANIAHHAAKAKAAALVEYEKKTPPRIAPNGGTGGIVSVEKPFRGFSEAAKEAAVEFKPYG